MQNEEGCRPNTAPIDLNFTDLDNPTLKHRSITNMGTTAQRTASPSQDVESRPSFEPSGPRYQSYSQPFAGRLGANQAYVVDGVTSEDEKLLQHQPDATPHMSFRELMDCRPITNINLWKAALIEGIGISSFMLLFR
jgi:hypothetical protein